MPDLPVLRQFVLVEGWHQRLCYRPVLVSSGGLLSSVEVHHHLYHYLYYHYNLYHQYNHHLVITSVNGALRAPTTSPCGMHALRPQSPPPSLIFWKL